MEMKTRTRLERGLPCIGAWLTVPSPAVAEAMVSMGEFHWMAVDMEHGNFSTDQAAEAFQVADAYNCTPFARIGSMDPYLARNLLDAGVQGLIVSTVEDAQAFEVFAQHCHFPPAGRRGVALTRANLWGAKFDEYMSDFRPILVPQIETRKGAEALAAITGLETVDAIFLGPYDLSADLGVPGDFEAPVFKETIKKIREDCPKPVGIHQVEPDSMQLAQQIDDGFQFIAYGTDLIAMRRALSHGDNS